MARRPVSDDIPAAEVFPIGLFVILLTLRGVTAGVYEGLGRPQPEALPFVEQLASWLTLWAWFSAYAYRHRIPLIMDFGWLFFGIWLVVVPYFLFKTQRWRALLPIAAYVFLAVVANGLGFLVRVAVSHQ
jgi:hypothetical protein